MEYRITAEARRQWQEFPLLMQEHRDRGKVPLKERAPDLPPRPCARCRKVFQPTPKRRMLCDVCFRGGDPEMRR